MNILTESLFYFINRTHYQPTEEEKGNTIRQNNTTYLQKRVKITKENRNQTEKVRLAGDVMKLYGSGDKKSN